MYIEHPFKYNGVYYAKIDGELIEITKEQAKVMLSFYRNSRNYEKRWSPKDKEKTAKQTQDDQMDSCQDLLRELEEEEKNTTECRQTCKCGAKNKKRKMVLQREMILDCVFSENAEGLSVQDLPDNGQPSVEDLIIEKLEYQELYSVISMLTEEEQNIIKDVFFENIPQVQVARELGITPQALNSRLKYIMMRLRRMYTQE